MTNTFVTATSDPYALANSVAKFKQGHKVQAIFNDAYLLDDQGNTVCQANVAGAIESIVEMVPIDGVYVKNIKCVISLAGGNIVKFIVN